MQKPETNVIQRPAANSRLTNGDWSLLDDDFLAIADIAKTHFGLNLTRSKIALIQSRLGQRMQHLCLDTFSDYLAVLNGPSAADERTELLSVLTTNVTHFFRENHHFDTLRNDVLPPLLDAANKGARVRLWSAGCSTGPEAYSLAMTVLDMCPHAATLDVKILATDIDPLVIEKAKEGVYNQAETRSLPDEMKRKYFHACTSHGVNASIHESARALITFGVLNLIEPLPFNGPFDVIFCRNVAIYFDRDTQSNLWGTFSSVMQTGSHLFIGHSEHLTGPAKVDFNKTGFTMYQKNNPDGQRA